MRRFLDTTTRIHRTTAEGNKGDDMQVRKQGGPRAGMLYAGKLRGTFGPFAVFYYPRLILLFYETSDFNMTQVGISEAGKCMLEPFGKIFVTGEPNVLTYSEYHPEHLVDDSNDAETATDNDLEAEMKKYDFAPELESPMNDEDWKETGLPKRSRRAAEIPKHRVESGPGVFMRSRLYIVVREYAAPYDEEAGAQTGTAMLTTSGSGEKTPGM
ncbi:hypothetical protein EDD18DRAFT_1332359 [Armillaria luteobubalina]|uniref:Uncharacterized protein n=1 Tax=Armillaria luteobubalina TaxID=153913 RepID=A0AA39Q3J9_9AGAR|nr:hypothetical protein EDD18DRAFT_1332359 [Armillaria luteobubalina]